MPLQRLLVGFDDLPDPGGGGGQLPADLVRIAPVACTVAESVARSGGQTSSASPRTVTTGVVMPRR